LPSRIENTVPSGEVAFRGPGCETIISRQALQEPREDDPEDDDEEINDVKRYRQFVLLAIMVLGMESAGLAQLEKATARIQGDF
jgi:hypothetical protein